MRGIFRTEVENRVGKKLEQIFVSNPSSVEIKLENFPKYVRRQHLKRFLVMYELFKMVLPVKGSIVECGVYEGFGLMAWAKLSTILEPENLTRRIYGFDTFDGFPAVSDKDRSSTAYPSVGDLRSESYEELIKLIEEYDRDRFLGHIPKIELVRGDLSTTIPEFVAERSHLLVSLLFVDCDLYEPTKAALEAFVPRMPKGAILAFDELDNPLWPGETLALLDTLGIGRFRLKRLEWDPLRTPKSIKRPSRSDSGAQGRPVAPEIELSRSLSIKIRKHVLGMTHRAKSSHVGTNFSMADLLAVLYGGVLRVDPRKPQWDERDRFILSKGHGCAGLYAVLAERGFFPFDWLEDFYQNGSRLPGHVSHKGIPGVEASTGSLGHGLSIGCGMALTAKRDHARYRVFTLLSDGECNEGSVWEAAMFASHHHLDNLVAIVDYNKMQGLGHTRDIMNLDPLAAKWQAFGWSVHEIDGHDHGEVQQTLMATPFEAGKPSCIVAHTVKGKGVSFMENQLLWHYRAPDDQEYRRALAELKAGT